MCIIIDANMATDFSNGADYTSPIAEYIKRGGSLVVNDQLFAEYPRKIHSILSELGRSKKLKKFDCGQLPDNIASKMISDDPHIVDLVLQSKTTVVCTKDEDLTADLKNPNIVRRPRCSVYKHEGSKSVLVGCCA